MLATKANTNPSAWTWADILLSTCIAAHGECCSQESQNEQMRRWSETTSVNHHDLGRMFCKHLVILTVRNRIV